MNLPDGLHYTKDHEWLRIDGTTGTIGITDFAQSELGDIVYVDIETIGQELETGAVFGTIEAVKTVADLFLPAKAKIIAKNEALDANPELVNESPYENGWLIKVEFAGDPDRSELLSKADYAAQIAA